MMIQSRRDRTGFTMPEMLIALLLVGLVMTLAARLFQSTIRAGQSTAAARDAAGSLDAALAVLRADVWGAASVDIAANSASATIHRQPDVTWSIADSTLTRRGNRLPPRIWTIPAGANFASDGADLVLRFPRDRSQAGGEVRLVSQPRLIKGLTS
jgi:prepilin-type N-terminal cleavage/methylation domain-containing protein